MRLNLKGLYIQDLNRSSHKQECNPVCDVYIVNPPVASTPESIHNTMMRLRHRLVGSAPRDMAQIQPQHYFGKL